LAAAGPPARLLLGRSGTVSGGLVGRDLFREGDFLRRRRRLLLPSELAAWHVDPHRPLGLLGPRLLLCCRHLLGRLGARGRGLAPLPAPARAAPRLLLC